jgi:hypothetical protein
MLPVTTALDSRDRFSVRTELDAEALWRRLLSHPMVRAAVEPAPDPPPPEGAPFLLARQSDRELRLRHWAGPADAASPVIVLRIDPDGHGGTLVHGAFERRSTQRPLLDLPRLRPGGAPWVVAGVLLSVLGIALLTPVLAGAAMDTIVSVLVLSVLFTIPTALVFVPGLLIWNAESRRGFIAPMWELMGEVFTPIALPEAHTDAPFRGHARLPAPSE